MLGLPQFKVMNACKHKHIVSIDGNEPATGIDTTMTDPGGTVK